MSKELKNKALRLVLNCVRNTFLEDLHAGIGPSSKVGDYSDVKVLSPYGEIPWSNLSRINDDEMKELMIEVVNKVYTFLLHDDQLSKSIWFTTPNDWNEPEIDESFGQLMNRISSKENESSDSVTQFDKLISSWEDYSSEPAIFDQMQYYTGILVGLTSAGKISFHEHEAVWMPRLQKRKDLLLAIRRAFKRKGLTKKDKIDLDELENGSWIAINYRDEPVAEEASWQKLKHLRDRETLIPAKLIKTVKPTQK